MRIKLNLAVVLAAVTLSVFVSVPTLAQSEPAPNARVRLYETGAMSSVIATFAPGSSEAMDKQEVFTGLTQLVSPDRQWTAEYGIKMGAQGSTFSYSKTSGAATEVTVPTPYFVGWVQFSTNSKYLGFSMLDYSGGKWTTASIDLATGETRQFSGTFQISIPNAAVTAVGTMLAPKATNTPEATPTISGAAFPLGWSDDGKTLYISPFSFGAYSFTGLYKIDLSAITANSAAPVALPAAETIIPAGTFIGAPIFTPEGTGVVYAVDNPANPPSNFQALTTQTTVSANELKYFDFASGQTKTLYAAKSGEGIAGSAWSQDGKTLYFVTGGYKQSYFIATPRIVSVELSSGTANEGSTITLAPDSSIFSLLACSDSIFLTVRTAQDVTDPNAKTDLHSISLSDLGKLSDKLVSSGAITMVGCVPAK